jgi:hypothetical protein
VPVTFGKLPTTSAKNMKLISGFPQHQQHMLNLIAPSGLVPPGTTITVPMDQITRNLALLQHVSKSNSVNTISNVHPTMTSNTTSNIFSSILNSHQAGLYKDSIINSTLTCRLTSNVPDLAVPNCLLSEDIISPYTFSESGYEEGRDEEIDEIEVCADKSNDDGDVVLELDSPLTDRNKNSFSVLRTSDSVNSFSSSSIAESDTEKQFVADLKSSGVLTSTMDMEIST